MFVRFRTTAYRLQLSLIETRRDGGKVRHEHIASFGSVPVSPSIADRLEFWARLHERLAKLSNRIDGETVGKILAAVHARIPMVTADEQRTLQLENAKADDRLWSGLRDMHLEAADGHKTLIAKAQNAVATGEAEATKAEAKAKAAKDRIERIERGESVEGGLGKPMTREVMEAILFEAGWTRQDIRRMGQRSSLSDEEVEKYVERMVDASRATESAALRAILRQRQVER